jgi:hypothetical protein
MTISTDSLNFSGSYHSSTAAKRLHLTLKMFLILLSVSLVTVQFQQFSGVGLVYCLYVVASTRRTATVRSVKF